MMTLLNQRLTAQNSLVIRYLIQLCNGFVTVLMLIYSIYFGLLGPSLTIFVCRYQLFEKHFENVFPYEDIFPLKRHMFLGVNATFPNNIPAILRRRYGPLYRIPIPYKWKCYINTTSMTIFLLLVLLISSLFVCIRTCHQYLKYEVRFELPDS